MVFSLNGARFNVDTKYELIGAIGQGSYGVVCSALNRATREKVAIKKITPMCGDAWDATHTLREVRIMRHLGEHPNIVGLRDLSVDQRKDELYICMELLSYDLHHLIQSKAELTDEHVKIFMLQLLRGTEALHEHRIFHRDLKPANLLVNEACELRITDFGLSRQAPPSVGVHAGDDERECEAYVDPQERGGASAGAMTEYVVTRWYRPPELMLNPGIYDGAVDVWSIGCIMAEMLGRRPLFPGKDYMDQLRLIFGALGSPPADTTAWGYTVAGEAARFLRSLPTARPADFESLFPGVGANGAALLGQLLEFNPRRRARVGAALASSYFEDVRQQLPPPLPLHCPDLSFAFEDHELSLKRLRRLVEVEVASFRRDLRRGVVGTAAAAPVPTQAAGLLPDTRAATASSSRVTPAAPAE